MDIKIFNIDIKYTNIFNIDIKYIISENNLLVIIRFYELKIRSELSIIDRFW